MFQKSIKIHSRRRRAGWPTLYMPEMENPFIEINGEDFLIKPFSIGPPEGHVFPAKFPLCCGFHSQVMRLKHLRLTGYLNPIPAHGMTRHTRSGSSTRMILQEIN